SPARRARPAPRPSFRRPWPPRCPGETCLGSARFVAGRDLRLHLGGRRRASLEEDRDLVPERPFAVDPDEDVPLVVGAGGIRGRGAKRVVPHERAARIGVAGHATKLGVRGAASVQPAAEASGHILGAAGEERAHVGRPREVGRVDVAAGAVVAAEDPRPHHHVLAASRVLAVHLRELVHAGIDDPGPVAVHFFEPSLHRGGDRKVDLLDSAAPQLTPPRAPTSNRRRRAGSYVTASSSVLATSTAYSTFSPRYIRLRTTPGTMTSPSAALADSGTSVSDSGRRTRKSRWPGA